MNRLSTEKRVQILNCLTEGMSMRAATRLTGVSINTVTKLLVDVGQVCSEFQDRTLVNLPCKRLQLDEVWSFVGAKKKNCTKDMQADGLGDAWTWIALDADTKLIATWLVGERSTDAALHFLYDLKVRLARERVQITTDGASIYLNPMHAAFLGEADYAQLQKIYGVEVRPPGTYSPAQCMGSRRAIISGKPDEEHISTSFVERQHLTLRMSNRRFTRLTNAFSKKLENLEHSVALYTMQYNFCRIHKTLRCTPAMEAGLTGHAWEMEEIVGLL